MGVAVARLVAGVPTRVLLGDPAQTLSAPFYVGAVNALGAVVWTSAAAVCLFAWALVRQAEPPGKATSFLLTSGLVTGWLALDDLLLIHDEFLVDVVGVREPVTFAVYALVFSAYAWRHRATLLGRPQRLLVMSAVALFAASVLIDLPKLSSPGTGFVEDAAKFLGIAGWSTALIGMSLDIVRETMTPAVSTDRPGSVPDDVAGATTIRGRP